MFLASVPDDESACASVGHGTRHVGLCSKPRAARPGVPRALPRPAGPNQTIRYIDEFVATRWACGYCTGNVRAPQPYCCPAHAAPLVALEDALGAGRFALVDEANGECRLSRIVRLVLLASAAAVCCCCLAAALQLMRNTLYP